MRSPPSWSVRFEAAQATSGCTALKAVPAPFLSSPPHGSTWPSAQAATSNSLACRPPVANPPSSKATKPRIDVGMKKLRALRAREHGHFRRRRAARERRGGGASASGSRTKAQSEPRQHQRGVMSFDGSFRRRVVTSKGNQALIAQNEKSPVLPPFPVNKPFPGYGEGAKRCEPSRLPAAATRGELTAIPRCGSTCRGKASQPSSSPPPKGKPLPRLALQSSHF